MLAAGLLLLLLLGLPQHPRGGSRCPAEAPPGRNETGRGTGTARAPDVAALVALGGWLGFVLLYVGRFVRRSREETRLHLQYLRALPCRHREEEEEPLSGGTGSQPGGPGG